MPHLRRVWKRRRGEGTLIRTPKVPSLATPASCRPGPEFRRGPGPPGTLCRAAWRCRRHPAKASGTEASGVHTAGSHGWVRHGPTTVTAASDGALAEVGTLDLAFPALFRLPEFRRGSPSCPAPVTGRADPRLGISFRRLPPHGPRRPRTGGRRRPPAETCRQRRRWRGAPSPHSNAVRDGLLESQLMHSLWVAICAHESSPSQGRACQLPSPRC